MKIAAFILFFSLAANAGDINLAVGEQLLTSIEAQGSVRVTQSRAVKVDIQKGRVFLIAKKPGIARITVGGNPKPWTITVHTQAITDLKKAIQVLAEGEASLQLDVKPQEIAVTGIVSDLGNWKQLSKLKAQWKSRLALDVKASPPLAETIVTLVKKEIKRLSLTEVKIENSDGHLWLDVTDSTKKHKSPIQMLADNWGLEVRGDSALLELKPMIEIEITIAEMKKNAARSLGLKLPGAYSATIIPTNDLSNFITGFAPINAEFQAEQSEGTGKVLANPKLLCRSGETAQFLAGGELPIKISKWKSAEMIWKQYGVILNISPQADYSGAISTKIVTEISLIDEGQKIDGVPGLLTNRINTHFDVKGSRSIALSGLIKSEMGKSSKGTPLLSDIPILGELFKSHDFIDRKSELVVFVTPRVVNPEQNEDVSKYDFIWEDEE